jgi:hypothetical protein
MKFVLLTLLLSTSVFAESNAPDYHVEVNPKVYSPSDFEANGIKTGTIPAKVKRPDALPEKRDREAIFERVPGLAGDIAGMDELARDMLFVRAKNQSLPDLVKLYPMVDAKRLALLKKECAR